MACLRVEIAETSCLTETQRAEPNREKQLFTVNWERQCSLSAVVEHAAERAGVELDDVVELEIHNDMEVVDCRPNYCLLRVPLDGWKKMTAVPSSVITPYNRGRGTRDAATAPQIPRGPQPSASSRASYEMSWRHFNLDMLVPERKCLELQDVSIYYSPSIRSWQAQVPLSYRPKLRGEGNTVDKRKNFGRTAKETAGLNKKLGYTTLGRIAEARRTIMKDVCGVLSVPVVPVSEKEEACAALEMQMFLLGRTEEREELDAAFIGVDAAYTECESEDDSDDV